MNAAARIKDLLELRLQPVAVKFQAEPPEGIPHVDHVALSGCTYWKYATSGRTFYTVASDHFGCPVGSYTHGIDLPEETAKQLEGLVGTMVQLKYIRMDEVPAIPRRDAPFGVAIYGPASEVTFEPDVI